MRNGLADKIRRAVIEQSKRAHVGHIGSALSIADLVAALYEGPLVEARPDDPHRNRFILSKGHAALALYAALQATGRISQEELDTFCGDGTALGVHPEHESPHIDFSTGSLGQGLSMAAGAALAARIEGSPRRIYCVVSDAECNEGSVWEAAMFAAHNGLSNLTVLLDANGQQALGYTRDVLDLSPLEERWRAFGWDVHPVDGHDVEGLKSTFDGLDYETGPPHMLVAQTTFGKGISYMERRIEWHYWPMSDEQFEQALDELGAAVEKAAGPA